ncbi:hypothetical protein GHT07_19375 [Caenimonas koreensis DSM 17982]|uniref:FecR protein domain-containing protein n=1 Tax=Caenimonas koreensis DSM 17982 TaxID=1121255 RepID=A0A844BCN6_9BURK|nr:DUF6600 domain-containing protein [Caenimonas koreensis]MRD49439.1 hypothetical protein [Caenimonas koreensis DSM 17982]
MTRMMTRQFGSGLLRYLLPFLLALVSLGAWADPPMRVARISYVTGDASFSVGGERDWGRAVVNRPLITGDKLWVDRGARAELQLGSSAIRLGSNTSIALLNLDDRTTQIQLTQGVLNARVRRLDRGEVFEIATPNLAYSIRKPGIYRIEVDPQGDSTMVLVRQGSAQVYGEGRAFMIGANRAYRFYDTNLQDFETFAVRAPDEFDRWSTDRDRRWDASPSRKFVPADMIGYADLDANGTWRKVPEYGNVWIPTRVAADWAPYRDGHWSWVEPWGWTWIDDAPWGFAPSHYGRWARVSNTWAWVPGPVAQRPVYAPALVAFIGTGSPQGGGGTVAWVPLGPREVYRPAYTSSREYFYRINNGADRNFVERSYVQRAEPPPRYANQQIAGAVIGMLASAFAQSKPVQRETVRIAPDIAQRAQALNVAPVAPQRASVVGAAPSDTRPPPRRIERPVVAQTAPPPPPVSFEAKLNALTRNAGRPLDAAAVAAIRPAAPASAPQVTVVKAAEPVTAPASSAARPPGGGPRSAASGMGRPGGPGLPPPVAPAPPAAPAPAATPTPPAALTPPAASALVPRPAPAPAAPAPTASARVAPAPVAPPAPVLAPRPVPAPPAATPPAATPPAVSPPVAAPVAPAPARGASARPGSERGQRGNDLRDAVDEQRARDGRRPAAPGATAPAATPPAPAATPAPPAPVAAPAPAARPVPAAPAPVQPAPPPVVRPAPAAPAAATAPAPGPRPQVTPPAAPSAPAAPAADARGDRAQPGGARPRAQDASEPASGRRGRRGEEEQNRKP